jgi:hypothetical protein
MPCLEGREQRGWLACKGYCKVDDLAAVAQTASASLVTRSEPSGASEPRSPSGPVGSLLLRIAGLGVVGRGDLYLEVFYYCTYYDFSYSLVCRS